MLYCIRRDKEFEQSAYQMLLACRFAPVQSNNLALDKELAIDFYNYYIKHAGKNWEFIEKDNLDFYKLNKKGLELVAEIPRVTSQFEHDEGLLKNVNVFRGGLGVTSDKLADFAE